MINISYECMSLVAMGSQIDAKSNRKKWHWSLHKGLRHLPIVWKFVARVRLPADDTSVSWIAILKSQIVQTKQDH